MARTRFVGKGSHRLTLNEANKLRSLKREADAVGRARWVPKFDGRPRDEADLALVSATLWEEFDDKIVELSKRFPRQRLNVLFEGCGVSPFPEQLVRVGKSRGIQVRVFRSDLYSPAKFRELIAARGNKQVDLKGYRRAAPEELHDVFGGKMFHLVVSRAGGLMYTPFSKLRGIENVCKVLKPGGEAHIFTADANKPPLPRGSEIRLYHYRTGYENDGAIGFVPTEIQEFFRAHPEYVAGQHMRSDHTSSRTRYHPIIVIKRKPELTAH